MSSYDPFAVVPSQHPDDKEAVQRKEVLEAIEKVSNFLEKADYVNSKTEEIIESGLDPKTQQLQIAVLACLNIADEHFSTIDNIFFPIFGLRNIAYHI